MQPVRIAVIGAGLIGRKHVEYTMACPDALLVAVADPDPSARALAEANGAAFWADPSQMLAEGGIDGAIVATPTALHEPVGLQCIGAGVHALIEKPICHDVGSARRLCEAADAAGVRLLTGHHRRYNPLLAEASRIIQRGDLGRLVGLSATWSVAKPAHYFDQVWRRQPGGGPVLTNLIHEIDLMRAMIGEIREISAMTSSAVRGFDTEDTAAIALRFENGALGTVFLSDTGASPWTWEQATGENSTTFPVSGQNSYRIFGTEAALEFPLLRVWRHDQTPDWMTPIHPSPRDVAQKDAYTQQIAHFARVIRGQEEPIVSGHDGMKTLAATLAVFEAASTGATVRL